MSVKIKGLTAYILLLIVIVVIQYRGVVGAAFQEWMYHTGANNEDRVSRTLNIDISEKEIIGKDYLYIGTDSETNRGKYIFFLFSDKKHHEIYEDEGIDFEEAKQIGLGSGYEINEDQLIVWHTYTKAISEAGEKLTSHMYWMIFSDPYRKNVYINFLTGEIMEN